MYKNNHRKGFTLIELLVVIAIIGVLASIILASLGTARSRGRDARRLSDIRQMRTALQLYFNANAGQYPTTLTALVTAGYLPYLPQDPLGGATAACRPDYCYAYKNDFSLYHLGTQLENANIVLNSDADDSTIAQGYSIRPVSSCNSTPPNTLNDPCVFDGTDVALIYDLHP